MRDVPADRSSSAFPAGNADAIGRIKTTTRKTT
jgi:hypothetical protein